MLLDVRWLRFNLFHRKSSIRQRLHQQLALVGSLTAC